MRELKVLWPSNAQPTYLAHLRTIKVKCWNLPVLQLALSLKNL